MRNLLRITTVMALSFFNLTLAKASEIYTLDQNHTNITWSANHLGFSNVPGKFTKAIGELELDEQDLTKSKISVTIDVTSIVTGIDAFEEHLKGADFFNIKKYPTATFTSTSVKQLCPSVSEVTGDFTLLGVTKPITLFVTLNKIGINPITNKKTAGFSAQATIKRSEFGMKAFVPMVSDNINIEIEAEANIK